MLKTRRDVEALTRGEIDAIRNFHEVAQKYELMLVCVKCGHPFTGNNQGHEKYLSIECKCRELRGENTARVVG